MKNDEVLKLVEVLPPRIRKALLDCSDVNSLIEIVLDIGKQPEARFEKNVIFLSDDQVLQEDIDYVVSKVGAFTEDNRAGIERTLHRIMLTSVDYSINTWRSPAYIRSRWERSRNGAYAFTPSLYTKCRFQFLSSVCG